MAALDDPPLGGDAPPPPVIVLLDLACLEIVKTKRGEFQLLNGDDHRSVLGKHGRDPAECRPDIAHQELMALFDSPLNKAKQLKVYMRTRQNVLIEFHESVRIPRTYKRFAGLMVQLLHKLKVRAADGRETLLKVIKNPIQRHLPPDCVCYGFSVQGDRYTPGAFAARPARKPKAQPPTRKSPRKPSASPECSSSHEGTWIGPGSHVTLSGDPLTCVSPIFTSSLCTPDSSHWYVIT